MDTPTLVLETKLYTPPLRRERVLRGPLLARLRARGQRVEIRQ
jgi:hypothetical protein